MPPSTLLVNSFISPAHNMWSLIFSCVPSIKPSSSQVSILMERHHYKIIFSRKTILADLKILWHSLLQRMSSLTSWRCAFASPSSAFTPHLVEPFLKDSIQTMYIVHITRSICVLYILHCELYIVYITQ